MAIPQTSRFLLVAASIACLVTVGCGPSVPDVVPVSGTVTINGKPLAKAEVKFLPLHEGLDGNYSATGITDEEGKFVLSHMGGMNPGCCACNCTVTVSEGPLPAEIREMGQRGAAEIKAYRSKLENRPIPAAYTSLGTTPLEIDLSSTPAEGLEIELSRSR